MVKREAKEMILSYVNHCQWSCVWHSWITPTSRWDVNSEISLRTLPFSKEEHKREGSSPANIKAMLQVRWCFLSFWNNLFLGYVNICFPILKFSGYWDLLPSNGFPVGQASGLHAKFKGDSQGCPALNFVPMCLTFFTLVTALFPVSLISTGSTSAFPKCTF